MLIPLKSKPYPEYQRANIPKIYKLKWASIFYFKTIPLAYLQINNSERVKLLVR
jgi:hypothetical protein